MANASSSNLNLADALLLIEDIRAFHRHVQESQEQNLLNTARCCELTTKRKNALDNLEAHPQLRQALLFLSTDSPHTPTLETIVHLWTKVFPGKAVSSAPSPPGEWF